MELELAKGPSKQRPNSSKIVSSETEATQRQLEDYVAQVLTGNVNAQLFQKLIELMIWADKKKPEIAEQLAHLDVLPTLVAQQLTYQLPGYQPHTLIDGIGLLLGNCRDTSVIIKNLLINRIPQRVLVAYLTTLQLNQLANHTDPDDQEALTRLGSFLRSYHRFFTLENADTFFYEGRCLLMNICCKFFNCPEDLTRTSVLNIIMGLASQPVWKQHLYANGVPIKALVIWARNLCQQFRNEIRQFDQRTQVETDIEQQEQLEQEINDKIILWEELVETDTELFCQPFWEQIVAPLLVGAFSVTGLPLFTLKFSMLFLSLIVDVLGRLQLIFRLGELLFKQVPLIYQENKLGCSILPVFSLSTLLNDPVADEQESDSEAASCTKIHALFMSLLRSKDDHFLHLNIQLLHKVIKYLRKDQTENTVLLQQLGFNANGSTLTDVCHVLLNHFGGSPNLYSIQIICQILVSLHKGSFVQDDVLTAFVFNYRQALQQATEVFQSISPPVKGYVTQIFQYDCKHVESMRAQFQEPPLKGLLYPKHCDIQDLPFFRAIPDTPQETARYQLVKFMIIAKYSYLLLESRLKLNSYTRKYCQQKEAMRDRAPKPGQVFPIPRSLDEGIRCRFYDEKQVPVSSLIIDNDINLVVGFLDEKSKSVTIFISLKLKHMHPYIGSRKNHKMLCMGMKSFNVESQRLGNKFEIYYRDIDNFLDWFKTKRQRALDVQLTEIKGFFGHEAKHMPSASLI